LARRDKYRTLSELGEDWLLEFILRTLKPVGGGRLEPGDDAVELTLQGRIIVSGDMLVSSTDIPPGMTLRQAGAKAIVSVVSDFAAKAAQPLYFLVELGLPGGMRAEEFAELWSGITEAARLYGGEVVGGDVNQAAEVLVGVVGIGLSESPISRRGARPGDVLAVTGLFGRTFTGLHAALNSVGDEKWRPLLDAVYNPRPRLKEGLAIGRAGLASSSIDSSDGLESCLHELSKWSGVGFEVTDPPVDPLAREYALDMGLNLLDAVFRGGEEYELVVTIPPERMSEAQVLLRGIGSTLIPIGETIVGRDISVWLEGKRYILTGKGWRHFR